MKSSIGGSSSAEFWENSDFKFFRNPDDFPFRSNKGKVLFNSGIPDFSLVRASTSPSKIWANILVCSPGLNPSLASNALIPLMGGKDTPASGFALYLNRLMNQVKPEILAEHSGQRILIRAEPSQPEAVKGGFSIANCLREAGYVAELNLGGQELTNLRWTLDVQNKAPLFILTDQVNHRRFEVQTASEVLALLGEFFSS